MKQVLQNLKDGTTEVADVAAPSARAGGLLIRTRASVISSGTERMLVEFGRANLLAKARSQPEKVRQVLSKVKTDGLLPTIDAVRSKLDQPMTLGYSSSGVVLEVGAGVTGFRVGDRVVSNGPHAEVSFVPANLCAKIPDGVDDESAAFTVISSIALQGVRLAQPTLGECFVVTGLGLIGLLTVQLLRAHGCSVLGIDFDQEKQRLARSFGAETVDLSAGEDPVAAALAFSRERGVDGVLITAATKSSEPIHQAALMCRQRGRIVLIGSVGLELSRADFYEKELTFQVSCSYGPGRYDPQYEDAGHDYPIGFVRWTEQRNFEAVLSMIASRALNTQSLVARRFPIEEAEQAYDVLAGGGTGLGIVLHYPDATQRSDEALISNRTVTYSAPSAQGAGQPNIAVIGTGNYATRVVLPILATLPVTLDAVASSGGVSSAHAARKFGFRRATTDTASLMRDGSIDAVMITTRHNSHVSLAMQALAANKHVFVEKPLAIDRAGLEQLREQYESLQATGRAPILAVGFNRRFAPQVQKVRSLLAGVKDRKAIVMTINA
jgi:threonine dehydrogenase-like Zn-dependent dehydrogenase